MYSCISGMHYYECIAPNVESISRVADSEPSLMLDGSFVQDVIDWYYVLMTVTDRLIQSGPS